MPILQFRNEQGQRVSVSPLYPLPVYIPDTYIVLGTVQTTLLTTHIVPRNCFDWGVFDITPYIEVGFLATIDTAHAITARLAFFHHNYYGDYTQEGNAAFYRHHIPGTAPSITNTGWTRYAINSHMGFTRCAIRIDSRIYAGSASNIPVTFIIWGRY